MAGTSTTSTSTADAVVRRINATLVGVIFTVVAIVVLWPGTGSRDR